jgi:HSP20 family protein
MTTQDPVKKVQETRTGELMHPLDMFEEMEQWAERMFPLAWMRPLQRERLLGGGAIPQVDIIDREAELVVRAAVPGFGKDEIEITSTADAVTLRGHKEQEEKEEKGEYYRHETRREDFLRTVHLPSLVDDTRAKATFKDGMLELELPKVEPAKRRTLKIEEA